MCTNAAGENAPLISAPTVIASSYAASACSSAPWCERALPSFCKSSNSSRRLGPDSRSAASASANAASACG